MLFAIFCAVFCAFFCVFHLTLGCFRLESAQVKACLLVVDTEGIAVDSAVAGRKLTAEKVVTAIRASGIENKLNIGNS